MLMQRIWTALALLAILLPALFASDVRWWQLVVAVLLTLAAWEWGRLQGLSDRKSVLFAFAFMAMASFAYACNVLFQTHSELNGPVFLGSFAFLWMTGAAFWLKIGPKGWSDLPISLKLLVGVVILLLAGHAIVVGRQTGVFFLLSGMAMVWAADVGAYFAGRAFGNKKLAPSISPGKTWAGVWGGLLCALLLATGLVMWGAQPWADSASVFQLAQAKLGWLGLLLVVVTLVYASVVGDLVESLIKRAIGAKDSSALLPGHGGVLDRVDALLPSIPILIALERWFR